MMNTPRQELRLLAKEMAKDTPPPLLTRFDKLQSKSDAKNIYWERKSMNTTICPPTCTGIKLLKCMPFEYFIISTSPFYHVKYIKNIHTVGDIFAYVSIGKQGILTIQNFIKQHVMYIITLQLRSIKRSSVIRTVRRERSLIVESATSHLKAIQKDNAVQVILIIILRKRKCDVNIS